MIRPYFLIVILIWTLQGSTQTISHKIDTYIHTNRLDTFIVYSLYCSTDFIPNDPCERYKPNYLIWQHNGKFFLKRFDYCKTYRTLSIKKANPLTFYLSNKKSIDNEKIRQPTYYEFRKNKNSIDTSIVEVTIDHSCSHKFQLSLNPKSKFKLANIYDLDFKTFDNGKTNIYYDYNQKTKFKELIDLTTTLIKQLEIKK